MSVTKARRELTPGLADASLTAADILRSGFAASRRPSLWVGLKLKRRAMKRYGIPATTNWHRYTLDHLIPLSLGGEPEADENLWPQLKAEALVKDVDERHQLSDARRSPGTLLARQQWFVITWTA